MSDHMETQYNSVADRIAEFRQRYPAGALQPANRDAPYAIELLPNGATFIVYTAAAYRYPGDPLPGIASAWEPFPGRTDYTIDAELQNAETSAWGRAIVAALAADSRKGVASTEDVVHRRADRRAEQAAPEKPAAEPAPKPATTADRRKLLAAAKRLGLDAAVLPVLYDARFAQRAPYDAATSAELATFREHLVSADKAELAAAADLATTHRGFAAALGAQERAAADYSAAIETASGALPGLQAKVPDDEDGQQASAA